LGKVPTLFFSSEVASYRHAIASSSFPNSVFQQSSPSPNCYSLNTQHITQHSQNPSSIHYLPLPQSQASFILDTNRYQIPYSRLPLTTSAINIRNVPVAFPPPRSNQPKYQSTRSCMFHTTMMMHPTPACPSGERLVRCDRWSLKCS
jgi:hypothetical protein